MAEPLTKEEREGFLTIANQVGDKCVILTAEQLRRYEASIAALEAELARLRPLAEAVGGMVVGDALFREDENEWRVRSDLEYKTSDWEIVDNAPTPLAAFEAMERRRADYESAVAYIENIILRAAEEDADAH